LIREEEWLPKEKRNYLSNTRKRFGSKGTPEEKRNFWK